MLIKLIWDFRGPGAQQIAVHHAIHLKEFIEKEKLENMTSGAEEVSEFHHIAYLIVEQSQMIKMRDALRPQRAEYV